MVYARCLYLIRMWADEGMRVAHSVARRRLRDYLAHASRTLGCDLLATSMAQGCVTLFVDLNVGISIVEFVDKLKLWTSAWIVGNATEQSYWREGSWIRPVSPDDKAQCMLMCVTQAINEHSAESSQTPNTVRHHIIIITSRKRLLIPLKYRGLMAEIASSTACDIGAPTIAASAMRNHVHLLCRVPSDVGVSHFIDKLKEELLPRMLANRHLRRVEGWWEYSLAFTVSDKRQLQEEHDIADQPNRHRHFGVPNEMSFLYQRLDIKFFASLE